MSDLGPIVSGATPLFEVRVTRAGELVHVERCETLDEASVVVDEWSGVDGATCEIVDLLHPPRPDEDLFDEIPLDEPGPAE